jgi:hypothetical protein
MLIAPSPDPRSPSRPPRPQVGGHAAILPPGPVRVALHEPGQDADLNSELEDNQRDVHPQNLSSRRLIDRSPERQPFIAESPQIRPHLVLAISLAQST